jgi:hypothetical protein
MNLEKVRWEGVDFIRLFQDRDQCRALLNTVINPRVPQNAGNLMSSWATISIS